MWNLHKRSPWALLGRALEQVPFQPICVSLLERLELRGIPRPGKEDHGVRVRLAQPDDVQRLAEIDQRNAHKLAQFRRRLARLDVCFLAEIDGHMAGFLWIDGSGTPVEERVLYHVPMSPRAVYCYDEFVPDHFRRRGVLKTLFGTLGSWMCEHDRDGVVVLIEHGNLLSKRIHTLFGFRAVRQILCMRMFALHGCLEFTPSPAPNHSHGANHAHCFGSSIAKESRP